MTAVHAPSSTAVFPLIAEPHAYVAHTIDLLGDPAAREHWLKAFEDLTPGVTALAAASQPQSPDAGRRAAAASKEFLTILADCRRDPLAHGRPSVHRLCLLRYEVLVRHGFVDPYAAIKRRENQAALTMLADLLTEIDESPVDRRLQLLVHNAFAGNIFDLGCLGTIRMYESGQTNFHDVRSRLPPRPWCVDDLDLLLERWRGAPHRKAVVFVDNAGVDIVPMAREMLRRGTQVILAANSGPALNDVTHEELVELLGEVARLDPVVRSAMGSGQLQAIASGNASPEIDLSCISPALARASTDADLVVIQGMGRALETNYHARFKVDTLKLAMIKEPYVARVIGGRMYGVVCRFEPV
jgi:uncharacterized protein with ATP-grasp and redox domains